MCRVYANNEQLLIARNLVNVGYIVASLSVSLWKFPHKNTSIVQTRVIIILRLHCALTLTVRKAVVLMVWKMPRDVTVLSKSFTGHYKSDHEHNNTIINDILSCFVWIYKHTWSSLCLPARWAHHCRWGTWRSGSAECEKWIIDGSSIGGLTWGAAAPAIKCVEFSVCSSGATLSKKE